MPGTEAGPWSCEHGQAQHGSRAGDSHSPAPSTGPSVPDMPVGGQLWPAPASKANPARPFP